MFPPRLVRLEGGIRPRSGKEDTQKGRVLSTLLQGTRPRFASDTLMSLTDNTAPPGRMHRYVLVNG